MRRPPPPRSPVAPARTGVRRDDAAWSADAPRPTPVPRCLGADLLRDAARDVVRPNAARQREEIEDALLDFRPRVDRGDSARQASSTRAGARSPSVARSASSASRFAPTNAVTSRRASSAAKVAALRRSLHGAPRLEEPVLVFAPSVLRDASPQGGGSFQRDERVRRLDGRRIRGALFGVDFAHPRRELLLPLDQARQPNRRGDRLRRRLVRHTVSVAVVCLCWPTITRRDEESGRETAPARPYLADQVLTARAKEAAEDQRDDDRVVKLTRAGMKRGTRSKGSAG